MHVFEVSVNGVPVVLDHSTANLALEGGGLNLTSSRCQVWSLTQFHSVDFLQSGLGVRKCVFN